MTYPSSVDSFTPVTSHVTMVGAVIFNALQTAIEAIETELGTDPAGTVADLKTRLAKSLSGAGLLQFSAATTLTIASGSVTATQNYHRLDTEAAAASDDLDTITAGSEAQVLFVRTVSGARNVTLKHGTGNINCAQGVDIVLDNAYDLAVLLYDATLTKWLAFSLSAAVLQTASNVLSGDNKFSGGLRLNPNIQTDTYTALTTDNVIVCNKGTAMTINLPAATGSGRVYKITNIGAGTVTIDGDGSETVGNATTQTVAQWAFMTVIDYAAGAWAVI